jgi:hypothetical protein
MRASLADRPGAAAPGTPAWVSPTDHHGEGQPFRVDLDTVTPFHGEGGERSGSISVAASAPIAGATSMVTVEVRARMAGRQPPERVRSGHSASSLAGDARSRCGFGLMEGIHRKGELRRDTSSMATAGATALRGTTRERGCEARPPLAEPNEQHPGAPLDTADRRRGGIVGSGVAKRGGGRWCVKGSRGGGGRRCASSDSGGADGQRSSRGSHRRQSCSPQQWITYRLQRWSSPAPARPRQCSPASVCAPSTVHMCCLMETSAT